MQVLRIVLSQSSANYRKEETLDNKMTYPLPPLSTVIGAIHNACNFTEYHDMNISIQGRYESMHKEAYTDYCFLNSVNDDRGILIKMRNGHLLSKAYDKVASAKKSKGNSFRKGITIQIHNDKLLEEYRNLKNLKDKIDYYKKNEYKLKIDEVKNEKKIISEKKKKADKKSEEYIKICENEKQIKLKETKLKKDLLEYELEHYSIPISKFRSLTTSLKFYEILDNIELILHIKSDDNTLKEIQNNIYNLKSIGRSEDFVEVKEIRMVELKEDDDCEIISHYSAYLNYKDILNKKIWLDKVEAGRNIAGTKYYLNKNYEIKDGKRCFKKEKVLYASEYYIEETSRNVFIDDDGDKTYIVNFI